MDKGSRFTAFIAVVICIISMGWSIYFHTLFDRERRRGETTMENLRQLRAELDLMKYKNMQMAKDLADAKELEARLVEEKKNALIDLDKTRQRVIKLEGDIAEASKGAEASAIIPERLAKVSQDNEEIKKELTKLKEEKLKLEKELQIKSGNIPEAIDVGEINVHTGKRFSGKILVVNRKYDFVVIDLGRDHGMETGIILILHRGKKFLGKGIVEKVYERMSAATLLPDWMQGEPQVGDGVKKF